MRIANIRLEHIQNGVVMPTAKEAQAMALMILEQRRRDGKAPQACKGCGKRAKAQWEGKPLCARCLRSLKLGRTETAAAKFAPVVNSLPDDAPVGVQHIDGNTGKPFTLGGQ